MPIEILCRGEFFTPDAMTCRIAMKHRESIGWHEAWKTIADLLTSGF